MAAKVSQPEIHALDSPIREGSFRICAVEGPDVEILYTVPFVDKMKGRSLAKGDAKKAVRVATPDLRFSREQVVAILLREGAKPSQMSVSDGFK